MIFFEMCPTCAVRFRDSSIIRPNDFVVSTVLISKLPTLIARSAGTLTKPFLGTNYHIFGFTIV
jgi:hypothetical protein